jgi:DNA-directed RNA polymerase sigma subunit (sigma70/sigma32)
MAVGHEANVRGVLVPKDERERQVINLRLNSAEPLSLAKVADHMNLKKTTVQWLERRALQKLQRALGQEI